MAHKPISTDLQIRNLRHPEKRFYTVPVKNEPGLYLYVYKIRKVWYFRCRPPGEKNAIPVKMGPYGEGELAYTLKKARAQADQWREDIAGGVDPREATRKTRDNTFRGVRDAFLKRGQTAMGEPWKDNTKGAYTSALKHHKLKKWADVPVAQISHTRVQSHINALEEAGKFTAARRHLSYLRTFFSWCRRRKQGHIPAGAPLPTDGIELEKPRDNARKRELSPEEIKVFWRATQKLEYPWGAFYRVLLLTGQRLSEVAQLRRDDVKEDMWTQEANKADRRHLVPLNDLVLAELKAIPRHSDYYFSTRPDIPISGFSKVKKRLDKQMAEIQEEDDSDMPHWIAHDLRRTMTTRLRELRIPLHVCSRLLNHAEQGVTAEHYDMYDMLDEKTQAMTTWGNYLDRLIYGRADNVVEMKRSQSDIL